MLRQRISANRFGLTCGACCADNGVIAHTEKTASMRRRHVMAPSIGERQCSDRVDQTQCEPQGPDPLWTDKTARFLAHRSSDDGFRGDQGDGGDGEIHSLRAKSSRTLCRYPLLNYHPSA